MDAKKIDDNLKTIGMSDPTLTPPMIAKRLHVSPATVREWIRKKRLRAFNPGGRKRKPHFKVTEEDLQAFIESTRVSPAPVARRSPPIDFVVYVE